MRVLLGTAADVAHEPSGWTHHSIYLWMLLIGFVVFLSVFLLASARHSRWPDTAHLMEIGVTGATAFAGVHLLLCVCDPNHLVHLTELSGAHHELQSGVSMEMDILHRLHIGAAGVATIFLGLERLVGCCRTAPARLGIPEESD